MRKFIRVDDESIKDKVLAFGGEHDIEVVKTEAGISIERTFDSEILVIQEFIINAIQNKNNE